MDGRGTTKGVSDSTGRGDERPPQTIDYPGRTDEMTDRPRDEMSHWRPSGLLTGRRALITGGDSGIGRAVAVAFAKEGADVAISYLNEHDDANRTRDLIQAQGVRALTIPGDLAHRQHCADVVTQTVDELGGLDPLVNNVAFQQPVSSLDELSDEQWLRTFDVNIDSYFRVTKAALPHLSGAPASSTPPRSTACAETRH